MRSSKRNRSKNNRNRSLGNIINRVFDSSGPDGKVRGTPQQVIDKYAQLMRDAQLAGDPVAAENFAQHGEHYARLLARAQKEQEAKREQQEQENRQRQQERDQEREAQEADSGLVDTPETAEETPVEDKPRKPRRPRKPKAEVEVVEGTIEE